MLLSDGWELPFSEIIDWKKGLINGDEKLLMQIPGIVRSYSKSQVLAMKQQGLFLWNAYFSSIEKIVFTTLEVRVINIQKYRLQFDEFSLSENCRFSSLL